MSEQVEYHMRKPGSTVGRVSGSFRSWSRGDVLTVPAGELEHVGPRMYETRDETASDTGPRYQVREGDAGWWKVVDTRVGDDVEGESERSKEAAQQNADQLNADDG